MNNQELQIAIDKTVASLTASTKSYNPDLYNISLKHAQKLMDIQVARASMGNTKKGTREMNKPYAWVSLPDETIHKLPIENATETSDGFYLYAQPIKGLSGVEIIGISGKYDFTYEVDIIDFARAIEERHGIK